MGKITAMPGVNISPDTALAQVMDKKPVVVIIIAKYGDDDWYASWSSCNINDLVWGVKVLDVEVDDIVRKAKEPI